MRIRQKIDSVDGGDTGSETDPQFVASLKRGLGVLMAMARSGRSLSTGELATGTNLPKATITRLAYTLVKRGHAIYDPRAGHPSTGAASLQLGYGALGGNAVLRIAQPHMRTIANRLSVIQNTAMGNAYLSGAGRWDPLINGVGIPLALARRWNLRRLQCLLRWLRRR